MKYLNLTVYLRSFILFLEVFLLIIGFLNFLIALEEVFPFFFLLTDLGFFLTLNYKLNEIYFLGVSSLQSS